MCRTVSYDSNDNPIPGSDHCPWESAGRYKGRLSYHPSDDSSEEVEKPKKERVKTPMFFRETKDCIAFYSPFGDKECGVNATEWCKKHCHLKNQPFSKSIIKEIQKIDLSSYAYNSYALLDLLSEVKDAKFVTLFASGCIENIGSSWYTFIENFSDKLYSKSKEIKLRVFIRSPYYNERTRRLNLVTILSMDKDSPEYTLKRGLENPAINGIAVVDHPDNQDLISLLINKEFRRHLKHDVSKVINCNDCGDKMLCFKQTERFILIQKYKM